MTDVFFLAAATLKWVSSGAAAHPLGVLWDNGMVLNEAQRFASKLARREGGGFHFGFFRGFSGQGRPKSRFWLAPTPRGRPGEWVGFFLLAGGAPVSFWGIWISPSLFARHVASSRFSVVAGELMTEIEIF